ncbi:hypothetical protein Tsubulata_001645 [Turnera subulata]|uniref:Uncharacterized protein n=1 Tax=Turnera subulata TaxID=218843 RepID=A0A9Q0FUL0_9ROSI|nr:hypothetical protein Tsubulata_001645 [Turnera subulata]
MLVQWLKTFNLCTATTASPTSTAPTSYISIQNRIDRNRQTLSSGYEDVDSKNGPVTSSPSQHHVPMSHYSAFLAPGVEGRPEGADGDSAVVIGNRLITKAKAPPQIVIQVKNSHKFYTTVILLYCHEIEFFTLSDSHFLYYFQLGRFTKLVIILVWQEYDLSLIPPKFSNCSGSQVAAVSSAEFEKGSNSKHA